MGNATATSGLLNVTANGLNGTAIKLPYAYPDGSQVYLGNDAYGYPPSLYPNLTYGPNTSTTSADVFFRGQKLDPAGMLFLGPLIVNDSLALLSATLGIINNTSRNDVLGWVTIVIDASMIFDLQHSPEGLGKTGETLIVGPTAIGNRFDRNPRNASASAVENNEVRFVLPPANAQNRHQRRSTSTTSMSPFRMKSFPAVVSAWTKHNDPPNNAGAYISSKNEEGDSVSVGYATLTASFVDWVLLVEQSHSEVVSPINHLRNVVLICVFSVMAGLLLIIFPLAHYSIAPIRQLRAATKKTVEPYQSDGGSQYSSSHHDGGDSDDDETPVGEEARKEGFFGKWTGQRNNHSPQRGSRGPRRRTFRIPSKVPERRHFVTDELTDLTSTFNEMADELTMQYERLEERVKSERQSSRKAKRLLRLPIKAKLYSSPIYHTSSRRL